MRSQAENTRTLKLHHRSRALQIPIYLGKQLRSFIYMSDWKMLPMAAIIAALVSMVVRKDFFLTMEGTLKGSFSLVCVSIWNGCFNSIQVVCRERGIVKREHRSGMHISSYIISKMLYQALLCIGQSFLTLYVLMLCGVQFPEKGFFTPWLMLDLGITVFLISYASDMLSLFVSCISHTTTGAMTVMPFVLIFQLVFSGGIFNLPEWSKSLSNLTISNWGLMCINAQADYNNQPMVTGWNTLVGMQDREISGSLKVSDVIDVISNDDGVLAWVRNLPIVLTDDQEQPAAAAEVQSIEAAAADPSAAADNAVTTEAPAAETAVAETPAAAEATTDIPSVDETAATDTTTPADNSAAVAEAAAQNVSAPTIGQIVDIVVDSGALDSYRNQEIPYSFSLRQVIDQLGREKVKDMVQTSTAIAMAKPVYERTEENITRYWLIISGFALLFAAASVIALEFIDKDKR